MEQKLIIGLSGINATDNPGPGVPIARSLKEWDPEIQLLGLSYDVHDPGNYMSFLFDQTFRLPYPTKGWEPIFSQLNEIKSKFGLDVIIPSLDVELPAYIRYQKELLSQGIRTFLPTEEQFKIRSKDKLANVSERICLKYPKTFVTHSVNELKEVVQKEIDFPCMIKGNYYKAYLVFNLEQAILKFTEIADEWGYPILVQKVIQGKEINLIGLGDGQGNSCGMVAIKKLTTTQLGKIWTGVTISHPELIRLGSEFIKQTQWKGPFELECIEANDGIYMIEVNPRFPAWVYFATGVGMNLPARLIHLAIHGDCDRTQNYQFGQFFVRYTYEIVTGLEKFSQLAMQD